MLLRILNPPIERAMAFSSTTISPVSTVNPQHLPFVLHRLESCKSMDELKQIHASVVKTRLLQTQLVLSKILSFCALSPSGNLDYARSVFTHIENPNLYLYNAIIRGVSHCKRNPEDSILFYREMFDKGLFPDNFTLPFLFKACAQSQALREGEEIHVHAIKAGLESDVYVKNTLMRMYAVCGEITAAQKLFDRIPGRDLVSWTTLISGYAKLGFSGEAIRVFLEMVDADFRADEVTMVIVLSACAKLGDLDLGRRIHRYIDDNNVNSDVFVGNALVDMYLKCGDVDFAYKVFGDMPERNVVSWNSMILGLVQQGEFKEALSVFRQMQGRGVKPDDVTLVGVLNSCSHIGALELGKWVHIYIDRNRIKADGFIGNALVDMYAKCGSIDQALGVFNGMKCRDVYSYTAMIVGFAMHGKGERALDLFCEMSKVGIKPDGVTFVGVLSACSHVGLVDEGRQHFQDMSRLYNLRPQIEHYGCMVDLLGRIGLVEEAYEFIRTMPIEPDAFVWGALLGACRIHGRVQLGESIAKRLLELEPERDGAYVLMSNIYASANRWRDAVNVRKVMKMQKVKKTPGCSMIELDGVVHEFRMGDKSHSRTREIYQMLDEIASRLKNEGYVAHTMDVFQDVAAEEKELALCQHSERLAIAFGLISTSPGTPLRIVKNLRMCSDCHSVTKFISKIFGREIVVRDRNRFHHFRGGSCSCGDFW
ncbi:pentatricopeptide repeat-containing protein At1g08070, chloroplastic-like [Magnolia sinica]|uniref:pentatricopeptide repeat-containing protein At1g08070, chloroplastic-like n=1 Tax=Magnolia sinica TaxID=86752 RepID=UPI00265A7112|nr:pentatricopeptide repeat-containing protein At1g08070, chloroplastic-like [Magnolia sinica]